MKTFKKILRLIVLSSLILLSSFGMISIFPNYRDRYMDNEIKIELVEKEKEDESESDFEIKIIK